MKGLASRPLLVAALEDHVKRSALIALCGEPGMGKGEALEAARVVGKQFGANVHSLDLSNLLQNSACVRMARESNSLLRRLPAGAWAVVCINGVPPLDERCVYRMATSIHRLREEGCCVVLSLLPEAMQLVEECPDAFVLWADELRVEPPERMGKRFKEEVQQLTAGIPALAGSLTLTDNDGKYETRAGREYHDALCGVVKLSLRHTLISDERKLRLAMLLLGAGNFVQLQEVVGKLDFELLQDISRHAPLFGVDVSRASFACAGLAKDSRLRALVFTLRDLCGEFPELCARAAALLLKEGRLNRAGTVLEFCDGHEDAIELTLRHCTELVNVGCADVVRRALPHAARLRCCTPQLRLACQTLLKLVDNARLDRGDISFDPLGIGIDEERDEALRISVLLASRLAWQGRAAKLSSEAMALTDALTCDLVLHLSVTHALVEGRGHAAYHLLVSGSQLSGKDTLAGQLLEADLAFAHVLMGLPVPSPSAEAQLSNMDGACMLCYLPAIRALDAVWRCGADTFDIGSLDIRAAQAGDELVQTHFLLAGALANARCGALSHAVVKCNRALATATRLKASYLADLSRIVCWAARINAADVPADEEFDEAEHMGPGMRALARTLEIAAEGPREDASQLREATLDRDVAWVTSGLLTGLPRLKPLLEYAMPPTWLVVIESMRAKEEDKVPRLRMRTADEMEDLLEHRIYVRLLGGLEVLVNGKRLPANLLERRRAKALVAYACSSPAHSMRRADVIDALWPECDYERGAKRIYAATNVINRAVRTIDPECRFFAARGTDHAMRLDTTYVRCDVEEFEELAHQAIDNEGNDDEVLSLVRCVQALYQGDLYVPPGDAGRAIDQRRIDLRVLYTDVLVAGAEAAYRRGSLRLSTRLCEQALLADETREDAIACLVRSLSSCGRTVEARDRAKAFTARMGAIRRKRANREKK